MVKGFKKEKLIELRERHGLTKSAMARKCGEDRQIIHNWETGRNDPTLNKLAAVVNAFPEVDFDYFFVSKNSCVNRRAS